MYYIITSNRRVTCRIPHPSFPNSLLVLYFMFDLHLELMHHLPTISSQFVSLSRPLILKKEWEPFLLISPSERICTRLSPPKCANARTGNRCKKQKKGWKQGQKNEEEEDEWKKKKQTSRDCLRRLMGVNWSHTLHMNWIPAQLNCKMAQITRIRQYLDVSNTAYKSIVLAGK